MKSKNYYQKVGQIWLIRAQEDILYAEGNFKLGFYTQVCFLCQQSAEKALKAFLRRNGEKITRKFKIHLLPILLESCVKIDKDFKILSEQCLILNEYYAPTRYPEILGLEFGGYNKETAVKALAFTKEIVSFAEKKLRIKI